MSKQSIFWVVYLFAFVFCGYLSWPWGIGAGSTLVLFILFGLLGWKVFGPAIKD